jgi:SAM-dependent methyltransferase
METYLYKEMFELERRHWWFAAKHRIVLAMLRRFLSAGNGRARVADVGCGCGRMLELLLRDYDATGIDASPVAVEFAKQRNVPVVQVALPDGLTLPDGAFDAVLMLDVLEHLEDDVTSAAAVGRLLRPGGILLLTVPAFQWLYGPHDVAHHHKRRYNRAQLADVLRRAGFRVRYISYYNTLLFPLALVPRLLGRAKPGQQVSTAPPAAPINAVMQTIFAGERHVLGRLSLPFGLSLIAVAEPDR